MPPSVSFGIVPTHGAERVARHLPAFAKRLSEGVGAEVEVALHDGFPSVANALRTGKLGFGWLSPLIYARVADPGRLRLMLRTLRAAGGAYYCGIFARESSPLKAIKDLAGKRLAWVTRESVSGYLLPAHALKQVGVSVGAESFLGTHAAVVRAVARGDADAGATFCSLDSSVEPPRVVTAGWNETADVGGVTFRMLDLQGPIPSDVVCASMEVETRMVERCTRALVGLSRDPAGQEVIHGLFGAAGFAETASDDYLKLRATLSDLGVKSLTPPLGTSNA